MDHTSPTLSKAHSTDGTPIAWEQRGEGAPLLLISGALCTGATDAPLAALLAPRFRVITYDRRGRGNSGDSPTYAVQREIEDLAAIIDEVGENVSVHGMSSGGGLALRAAAAGLPINQLSVYEPPFSPAARPGQKAAPSVAQLAELLAEGRRGDALAVFLTEAGMPAETLASMRDSPLWNALESVAHTLPYDYEVMGNGAVPKAELRRVGVRVMVVDGGASPPWMREAARLVAQALPRGRHRTLTGQTHEVAPHVLAPVLEDFFTA
ncbi:alpha/beta fold hydrolase [Streptomyces albipurpureus]|uniref:Alpha/beta fold hydrolase n=1 Tax=Streptomyces albipurpureus TaxID=2897419 RepID=A0ABT0UGL6_9ACTN|nr:alpha/beta fold hydrolase [Streptomyces sp. CWNU-1]MCM2387762.1 alpha/beta fold hydrolase [Streptomyces sp. CWNU-1]